MFSLMMGEGDDAMEYMATTAEAVIRGPGGDLKKDVDLMAYSGDAPDPPPTAAPTLTAAQERAAMRGPSGLQGVAGEQGAAGEPGAAGADGAAGARGALLAPTGCRRL